MSSSERRVAANQSNAEKSSAPVTIEGKRRASRNATRHGLLSAQLVLDDENTEDFRDRLFDLQQALAPVGAAELVLVERIAIAVWRQRRLVAAERAALGLSRAPHRVARRVSEEIHPGSDRIKEDDLQPFTPDHIEFCRAIIAEVEMLEEIDFATLPKLAPRTYEQLIADAEDEEGGIVGYLKSHDNGLTGFVAALLEWSREQLREAEKRPRIRALAEHVRARGLGCVLN